MNPSHRNDRPARNPTNARTKPTDPARGRSDGAYWCPVHEHYVDHFKATLRGHHGPIPPSVQEHPWKGTDVRCEECGWLHGQHYWPWDSRGG